MKDNRHPDYKDQLINYVEEHNLQKIIIMLGLIPRQDQLQLLRQAVVIIQPSLFEGWSSLVEDARALGKPIIVSDIPIHREQCPYKASFFDPNNEEQLRKCIIAAWKENNYGPNTEDEEWAKNENKRRLKEFAENFISIAEKQ